VTLARPTIRGGTACRQTWHAPAHPARWSAAIRVAPNANLLATEVVARETVHGLRAALAGFEAVAAVGSGVEAHSPLGCGMSETMATSDTALQWQGLLHRGTWTPTDAIAAGRTGSDGP